MVPPAPVDEGLRCEGRTFPNQLLLRERNQRYRMTFFTFARIPVSNRFASRNPFLSP